MFKVDDRDPMPLYAQLERAIKFAVATGQLNIGDQLPTVRQLAVDLRINANTVAKVYAELERVGILGTRRGVGTFVQAHPADISRNGRQANNGKLDKVIDRALAEAASLGFSANDVLDNLINRRKKEKMKNG
ncbi:MAG TPA: GntR family transcriptional regulator [Blastocatellia bacterium]|nr:GntR family transcriptional regulator [Blastocatellia bacterium]